MNRAKVVILGAGFGGLSAAKDLDLVADVTLIDKHNFQTFLPLLSLVSTAGLAADHVAFPIRGALRGTKIKFKMGTPVSIDYESKNLQLDSGDIINFDYLIIALGSATNDFNVPGVNEYALGMKSIAEALSIRSEVMRRFEDICRFDDDTKLSISIVGGGPTGVVFAGALSELKKGPLRLDNHKAALNICINLIEAGARLLPDLSNRSSEKAKIELEKLGVNVFLNTYVKEVKYREIKLNNEALLDSEITVWVAGVSGEQSMRRFDLPQINNRIVVDKFLCVTDTNYIFAIGDIAGAKDSKGNFLPMVAPVAIQQGKFVAGQVTRLINNRALKEFIYKDKGTMATIGRNKAVVEYKSFKISGRFAWLVWLFLHLAPLLIGKNKVSTVSGWLWNYITFDRANRHIMDV